MSDRMTDERLDDLLNDKAYPERHQHEPWNPLADELLDALIAERAEVERMKSLMRCPSCTEAAVTDRDKYKRIAEWLAWQLDHNTLHGSTRTWLMDAERFVELGCKECPNLTPECRKCWLAATEGAVKEDSHE